MGEDQYLNITVEQELKFPDTESLAALLSLKQVCDPLHGWLSASSDCSEHSRVIVCPLHFKYLKQPSHLAATTCAGLDVYLRWGKHQTLSTMGTR